MLTKYEMRKGEKMLKDTDKIFYGVLLLLEKQEKITRINASPYLLLKMRDVDKSEVQIVKWNTSLKDFAESENTLLYCEIKINEYQGNKQYILTNCRPAMQSEADINDYVKAAPIHADILYDKILDIASETIHNPYYLRIIQNIFEDYRQELMYWSAAKTIHHNERAGLLYHTYCILLSVLNYCKIYDSLNKDLLAAGAILHDIGKLKELDTTETGTADYTMEGKLFGHLYLGCEILKSYKLADIPEMDYRLLQHMIASHHGKQEWGAFVTPKIPEAIVLHYIDNLDSKIDQCRKALEGMDEGTFTKQIFGLDTSLLKL